MTEQTTSERMYIDSIGTVRRSDDGIYLEIFEAFRPGLKQLGHFSHVIVLWWVNQLDDEEHRQKLQTYPPYAGDRLTGVFACRSPYRPNPIAITTCKIVAVAVENGIVKVVNIDALDGSPIVDLKAYFPASDRVKDARIPDWLENWPEWMPEEGLGL